MFAKIPIVVDAVSEKIRIRTEGFVKSKIGKWFLAIVLVGPFTFLPTMWVAWTAENIDALRTLTWPAMVFINLSGWLGVIHKGDWRMRLVMFLWIIAIASVWLATIVR